MDTPIPIIVAIASSLALASSQPPAPARTSPPAEQAELTRAELVVATDGTTLLVAYDADDNVVAEIAISADGFQASIDDVFVDAEVADDGTLSASRWRRRA